MKIIAPLLLFSILMLQSAMAQTPLGVGIVKINFDDKTVVDFYKYTSDTKPAKHIEFFNDTSINSFNIRNLKVELKWLLPESLWLDYSQFAFRCKTVHKEWLEVIVNNETGASYWIRKTSAMSFLTWEEYLKDMFSIGRRTDRKQVIRQQPNDSSPEVVYKGAFDCFAVKSMKGDWIEISTYEHCDIPKSSALKNGWIRWKKGDELLIEYFTTS